MAPQGEKNGQKKKKDAKARRTAQRNFAEPNSMSAEASAELSPSQPETPREAVETADEAENEETVSVDDVNLSDQLQRDESASSELVTKEDILSTEAVKPADDCKEEELAIDEAQPAEGLEKEEAAPSQEVFNQETLSAEAVKPEEEAAKEEAMSIQEAEPAEGLEREEPKPSEELSREETLSAQEVKPADEVSNGETVPAEMAQAAEDTARERTNSDAEPAEEHPKEESQPAEEEANNNGIDAQEALKQAMDDGNEDVVLKLYAANVHQTDSSGKSLLAWAMTRNCHELIQRLSESGVVFDPEAIHQELELSDPFHLHHTVSKVLQLAEHQRIGFCQTHTTRPVQAWCNTCNMPICNLCMGKRGEHKDHDTDADLNACLHDHKDGFLSSLQEVDEGVQALKDQCQVDASNGQCTINNEFDAACVGIDASMLKHADASHAQNDRDDEEIAKLQARIDELKAAKEERQRQRESFDEQAQAAKSCLSTDAHRHCEAVESWQHGVLQKMDSASARAGTWRKAVCDALASRPEAHIDMVALSALRARKETQSFLANAENLQMPTFPDAVQMATAGAQSAFKSFQEAVNDTISNHSKTEKEKALAFLMQQKVHLDSLQMNVSAAVDDAGWLSTHYPAVSHEPDTYSVQSKVTADVIDGPDASAEGSSVTKIVNQEFDVGDTCECQDANAHWWPVMITAKNIDGTFACVVSDGFNSTWPQVHKQSLRKATVAAKVSEIEALEADARVLAPAKDIELAAKDGSCKDSETEAVETEAKSLVSVSSAPTAPVSSESNISEEETCTPSVPSAPTVSNLHENTASQEAMQQNSTPSANRAAVLAALPVPEDLQQDEFEMAKSQLEAYRKSEEEKEAAQKKGRFGRFGGLLG